MSPVRAYIGLGSNLDDPKGQLIRALEALAELPLCQMQGHSSLYATPPIGPQDQPDFINAVACLETRLSPLALLDQLQALEQRHRRRRLRHWGARTLDLDLLLYGSQHCQWPRLTVPHAQMHLRAFVLVPLAELASTLEPSLTLHGQPLDQWASTLPLDDIRRLPNTAAPSTASV
ncbi:MULTISPECIES: 2-amino-4-hydroxy-6-hydroxymethyldihydropteridine diphosphokinase [Halomonadaceae]|uniref:2-amino-4-hydroxy-6- hydroxymethyldihydropteridine diphosphokinase n=1 Tax=Halomonadaceae TaxID=28256 RepID=UPI0002DB471D|nr:MULTISPECIES: 2-amino-4-hydroxy-6-hydroxymethyldihydropteridine diphosphokinase [Halomonas]